jgi:hypothetical protein
MGEEPDLDPEITREFFENNILQLDPSLLTENGMTCFERFFKAVNTKEGKLRAKRRGGYMMDDLELIGLDYLWRVVLWSPDDVAEKAITLLKDVYTNLGPRLQSNQVKLSLIVNIFFCTVVQFPNHYDWIIVETKQEHLKWPSHRDETCSSFLGFKRILRWSLGKWQNNYQMDTSSH